MSTRMYVEGGIIENFWSINSADDRSMCNNQR